MEALAKQLLSTNNKLMLGDVIGFEDTNKNGVKDSGEKPAALSQLIYLMTDTQMAAYLKSFGIAPKLTEAEIGGIVRKMIDTKPVTQEAAAAPWIKWYDMIGFSAFTNYYSATLEEGADGDMVGHMAGRLVAAFPKTPKPRAEIEAEMAKRTRLW